MKKLFLSLLLCLFAGPSFAQTVTASSPCTPTTSATASYCVQRDANGNAFANSFTSSGQSIAAAGGTTTLTAASPRYTVFTGSSNQTLVMPDATTLTANNASSFYVNNNSSGTITINANGGGSIYSLPAGGYVQVNLLTNSIAAGTWDTHPLAPATWCIGTASPCNGARTNTALSTTPYINAGASSATTGGFYPQFGQAQSWTGDATTLDAQIGATTELAVKTTGVSIPSGNTYQINGTQIVTTNLGDVVGAGTCTWTPSDASGATLTFSGVSTACTKIGRQVYVSGQVVYPATASGANAQIGGLPYTSANAAYANIPCSLGTSAALITHMVVNQNATTFSIGLIASNTAVTNAQLTGATVFFSCTYFAAS